MNLRTLGSASTLITAVSSVPSRPMTGLVGPAAVSEIDDHVGLDELRPLIEVDLLLAGEVVVEAVDDEDGHQAERQRDDEQEGQRQATLEGPREEPAQTESGGGRAAPAGQRSAKA